MSGQELDPNAAYQLIGQQHRASERNDESVPAVSCAHAYITDSGPGTMPILVMRDCTTKAHAISKTGCVLYATQFVVGLAREHG